MQAVSWEDNGWHVQLRNDGDDGEGNAELVVRIACDASVEGDDAVWIPWGMWIELVGQLDDSKSLVA